MIKVKVLLCKITPNLAEALSNMFTSILQVIYVVSVLITRKQHKTGRFSDVVWRAVVSMWKKLWKSIKIIYDGVGN